MCAQWKDQKPEYDKLTAEWQIGLEVKKNQESAESGSVWKPASVPGVYVIFSELSPACQQEAEALQRSCEPRLHHISVCLLFEVKPLEGPHGEKCSFSDVTEGIIHYGN